MSRIIVKDLPKKITEQDIRDHFGTKGTITDVKLKYKDGAFRQYCFVGYENPAAATDACRYFNNTCIKNSRIKVEMCLDIGSAKQKSWSKINREQRKALEEEQSMTKSQRKKTKLKKKISKETTVPEEVLKEPKFQEFLSLSEKVPSGGDGLLQALDEVKKGKMDETSEEGEDDGRSVNGEESNSKHEEEEKTAAKQDISDMDYLQSLKKSTPAVETSNKKKKKEREFYTVVIRAKGICKTDKRKTLTKPRIKSFLKPLKLETIRIPRKFKFVAYVGFATQKQMNKALEKDKSFIDGTRVRVVKYKKPEESLKAGSSCSPWAEAEQKLKNVDPVAETGCLFIRNLWYSVTEGDLEELFGKYGKVTQVSLPICKFTRRIKGYASVSFMFPEHATAAMNCLDGKDFKGRILHILPYAEQEKVNSEEGGGFKKEKEKKLKEAAGSWHNWNSLFLGSSAVIDIMAEKYRKSKHEILNSEGKQSVAVNLALGESQIVDETKRFLEKEGVSLDAFKNPGMQRSNTVILAKNLPAMTTAQELSQIFTRCGQLGRVVLPPSGVTAIVEFLEPSEAKIAFKSLAYSKFKYLPLYLEWAPVQTFSEEFDRLKHQEMEPGREEDVPSKDESTQEPTKELNSHKEMPEPDTTIYVKNLNVNTIETTVRENFEKKGKVYSVLIAKRRGVSQGYGFVQFLRRSSAQAALRELQDMLLDNQRLRLKLSEKTLAPEVKNVRKVQESRKQTLAKILVRNIPFQATRKEVRQLFVTFGELKSVRLPKKSTNNEHRGFGFVEFVTREDARRAYEALSMSTHLYGRRLVLEWAKDDVTVEELRQKTAEHFLNAGPSKKKKIEVESRTNDEGI